MGDDSIKAATAMDTRRPRQGETFWGEMVTSWKASGIGARRICRAQGLAENTFSLWRKKLSRSVKEIKPPLTVIADAACVISNLDDELAPPRPSVAPPAVDALPLNEWVTLSLAGVCIELSGVHADRIVRFVSVKLWSQHFQYTTKNWQGVDVPVAHINGWVAMCEMFATFEYQG